MMEPTLRQIGQTDWITLVIFGSTVFLVLAKALFYSRAMNFIILPFNNKYVFLYNKKDRLMNGFHVLCSVFLLLNISLFLYHGISLYRPEGLLAPLLLFGVIFASLFLFLLLKILAQLGIGTIFNSRATISEILFKKLSYLNYSALVMLCFNLLLTYVFPESASVFFVGAALVLIVLTLGWTTIIKTHLKFITSHFFYFILYLCALEIAPLIILLNALNV
jgi:hypothetical protein